MIEQVEKQLGSEDVEVRRHAVMVLGNPRAAAHEDSVRLLLKAMQDASWRVRKTAVEILLESYPLEHYISGLINLLYVEDNAGARNSAIESLVKLGRKITANLMEAFDTPNADVRKFIIDVIGQLGDRKALPLLVGAVKDDDENVRAAAVEYLGGMGEPSVVTPLLEILESGDLWTAYPAVDALGRIGDKKAMPALLKALERKTLREPALRALGRLADAEALEHIVPCIEDRSRAVAHEALKAAELLYRRGVDENLITDAVKRSLGDRAIDVLLEHAWSNKPEISGSAILFLGLLKDERALRPLLELSIGEDFAEDVKKALVYIGRQMPESLLPLFKTDDLYLKRFLCDVVAKVASPSYLDVLKGLISDEDGHIRSLAAIGLAGIGDPGTLGTIKRLMSDPYVDVQEAAVKALVRFGDALDGRELLENLKSTDAFLRKNTALLLGSLKAGYAVSALGFALKDGNVGVRKAVVTALSMIKTEESAVHLTTALTDEDADIRAFAALSLGEFGTPGIAGHISLMLNDSDDMVRVSAAKALGALGEAGTVAGLIDMLVDSNGFVVAAAIDSLGRLGGDEARDALLSMLSSEDREIRRSAIRGLAQFDNTVKDILLFIGDGDWATRVAAVEALMGRREDFVRRELERLYDVEEDPVVRKTLEKYINA